MWTEMGVSVIAGIYANMSMIKSLDNQLLISFISDLVKGQFSSQKSIPNMEMILKTGVYSIKWQPDSTHVTTNNIYTQAEQISISTQPHNLNTPFLDSFIKKTKISNTKDKQY